MDDRRPNPIRIIGTQRSRHLQTVLRSETSTSPHKALEDAYFIFELDTPTPRDNPNFFSSQILVYFTATDDNMSTSWKPQYRQAPPCQQQRKDEYLGMSPDIFGFVAGISVALLLAAMFLFPMYYMERHEQRGREKKSQITQPRSSGNCSHGGMWKS